VQLAQPECKSASINLPNDEYPSVPMASTRIWASFVVAGASCLSVQAARFTAGNLVVLKVGDTSINEKAS
jgi:hypothetical protein